MAIKVKKANDSSYKYNTDTGKLNPNYKAPKTSSSSSSGSASVRALQQSLNAKGANLVVDGIQGAKTNAAIAKYGSSNISSSTSSQSQSANPFFPNYVAPKSLASKTVNDSIPVQTTQASSYSNLPGSTISMPTSSKKKGLGSILSSIGSIFNSGKIKDALGIQTANAYEGYINNGVSTTDKIMNAIPIVGQIYDQVTGTSSYSPYGTDPLAWQPEAQNFATPVPDTPTPDPLIGSTDSSLNPDLTGTGDPYAAGTDTTLTKEVTDPGTGVKTTSTETSPLGSTARIGSPLGASSYASPGGAPMNNSQIGDASKNATLALKTDMAGATWQPNTTNNSEFQSGQLVSYADKFAKGFNTQQEATNYFNTAAGQQSVADFVTKGGKIQDIINKVQPVTNGVVPAQGTAQYLDLISNKNPKLQGQVDSYNNAILMQEGFNTAQEKLAYTANEEFKKSQEAIRDSIERNELRKEASVREKANWMIDKSNAEMDIALTTIEQNRLMSKGSMIGLLAKLGALDTTSGAGMALANIDQKYQAQTTQTRNQYMLASREIEMNMNSDINDLENTLEENIIKINSDLSKSERDVATEVMKLRYDTQKTSLEYKMKYEDALRIEKDKAIAKAESASANYNAQWSQLVGYGIAPEMIPGMLDSKGKIKQTTENATIIQNANQPKLPETKPDYLGQSLNIKDTKLAKLRTELNNSGVANTDDLINTIRDNLASGWSLDQIALNLSLLESEKKILKDYIIVK